MKAVSFNAIERAIDKVDNQDDDGLEALSEKYATAQPTLLSYAMSAVQEYQNDKLEGLIIYYFCLLLACFEEENLNISEVTEQDIEGFEEPFFETLDAFFESDNQELMEDFCAQTELVRFMGMEVSTEDEDGSSLDDETATQLYIVSMAMIGLLSRSVQ